MVRVRRPAVDRGGGRLRRLLRFETGPIGAPPIGYAFLVAAALPLVLGRGWRVAWAVRAWILAIACWATAWASGQTWFPVGLPSLEVLLAFAAAGVAIAAALGMAAFETDLRGYRFGWRQLASVTAAAGVVLGLVPATGAALDGRWNAPSVGYDSVLPFLVEEQADVGPFRVLWLGDPQALPAAGWQLDDGIAYATTDAGTAILQDRWAGADDGPTRLLADAVLVARDRGTSRLGRLLAPMAVRYVVLPQSLLPQGGAARPSPPAYLDALREQLDLVEVAVNPSVLVFRNVAWQPARATVAPGVSLDAPGGYLAAAIAADLADAAAVLPNERGYQRFTGSVPGGAIYLASASSSRWQLRVDGETASRSKAFGWANGFDASAGDGTLRYRTPLTRHLAIAAQLAIFVVVIRTVRKRRREQRAEAA